MKQGGVLRVAPPFAEEPHPHPLEQGQIRPVLGTEALLQVFPQLPGQGRRGPAGANGHGQAALPHLGRDDEGAEIRLVRHVDPDPLLPGGGADPGIQPGVISGGHHQDHALQMLRGELFVQEVDLPRPGQLLKDGGEPLAHHGHPAPGLPQILDLALPHPAAAHHQAGSILNDGKDGIGFHQLARGGRAPRRRPWSLLDPRNQPGPFLTLSGLGLSGKEIASHSAAFAPWAIDMREESWLDKQYKAILVPARSSPQGCGYLSP